MSGWALDVVRDVLGGGFAFEAALQGMAWKGLGMLLLLSLPCAFAAFCFGILGNYIQIGFLWTTEPLKLDFNKINPANGFKQLFSKDRLVELIKQSIQFGVVAAVIYAVIKGQLKDIVLTQRMSLEISLHVMQELVMRISIAMTLLFVVAGFVDYAWQRYSFRKRMRMSKYELKQEYKQSEGDPELKAERKRLAYEMLFHSTQAQVKEADAVITNPVHTAVAIRYDAKERTAPHVVAKGLRKNAEIIQEIAKKYRVPILRNVPLAHALHELDIDEEIPEELYQTVAEVLHFVYELKKDPKLG